MSTRYMTPLKYTDGNGREQRKQIHFELDPIELMDWTFANPFEANELQAALTELRDIETEESRDLTQDETRVLLTVVKVLADLSAGRPTDDGQYFIKDKNWTSSYAYRAFRLLLLTKPKELEEFMKALLDNDTMEKFASALQKANEENDATVTPIDGNRGPDSGQAVADKMAERQRLQRQLDALNETAGREFPGPSSDA